MVHEHRGEKIEIKSEPNLWVFNIKQQQRWNRHVCECGSFLIHVKNEPGKNPSKEYYRFVI